LDKIPQQNQSALTSLFNFAAQLYPSLKGEIAGHNDTCITVGKDNHQVLKELYEYWRVSCPEAGQPYWSIRSWTMLVWQPIFLAVMGVHGVGIVPSLTAISQKMERGMVVGFSLPDANFQKGPEQELIVLAGKGLRLLSDVLLEEFNRITRVRRVSAMRLVADTLLSTINQLGQTKLEISNREILALGSQWLTAMELVNESALMPILLTDGREQLVLNRKGCCMHYLRDDGDLCASCPKQKMPVRIQRLREEWDGHAGIG